MNKCLILLTSYFPFRNSEPFLETEIFFHGNNFDKIIILAQQLSDGTFESRPIPDNAEAYNIAVRKNSFSRLKDAFNGGIRLINPSDARKSDEISIGSSFTKKWFCEYFEACSQRQFNESLKVIEKIDFSVYDEVVIYSYWFFAACRTGALLKSYFESQGIKVKLFSRAHRYDVYEDVNRFKYLPLRSQLLKDVDKVFVCSEDGKTHIGKQFPEYKNKIECSYLGTFDKGHSYYDNTFHIVTCSRTAEVKRLELLIESLSKMKDSIGEIYWTHIGDGPLQETIRNLSKEKLGFMNCEFPGRMSNTDVMNYYLNHPVNLFVNVSNSEGLPVSIMEAISFGIPVLATDVGGTGEIVLDGVNGYLLSENFSFEEFENKFNLIYRADEEHYKQLRANARKIWEERFNAQKNYSEFSATLAAKETVTK